MSRFEQSQAASLFTVNEASNSNAGEEVFSEGIATPSSAAAMSARDRVIRRREAARLDKGDSPEEM